MCKKVFFNQFIGGLSIVLLTLCIGKTSSATIFEYGKELEWASKRDLTSSQFSEDFQKYRDRGFMMIDVDGYQSGNKLLYSMIWRENTDNRAWAEHRNLTSSAYSKKWRYYKARGYRPLDIAAYNSGSRVLYAGIWVKNKENIKWYSYRNLSSQRYGELFRKRKNSGYRLVDMEAVQTSSGVRYSAIWYKNTDNRAWAQLRNMTRSQYQAEVNEKMAEGYLLVDYEAYVVGNSKRYAAIWEKQSGYAQQVRTNRSAKQFSNLWREYRDKGYRLVDFERVGSRYGGVWIENSSRYRHDKKNELDQIIETYADANNLPGISVAIIKDNTTVYRRGFGYADSLNNKVAHSETVYGSASVSKVIGSTLAAKLEAEQVLEDGTEFSLDLSDKTEDYLEDMPSFHTHTLEELLSHLACIPHYSTSPSIANQTKHYSTATSAVESIWDTPLLDECTLGATRSYSTPAFTFVAAALEQATGRTIAQLFEQELFQPHGLNMRVQFAEKSLVSDYERAVAYNGLNLPTSYRDNSWKVIGGGIETSANQLARFGTQLLTGDIIDPAVRDERLWTRVNSAQINGLGWEIRTRAGKRVAEHNGSWTGARSYLRIYRDDGLVIAIMSNRTNHNVDDVAVLANDLEQIVL
jgi:CubicO group peptidase (beta-lactamase class C family)